MKSPIDQAKELLLKVENNPEALLFLVSGAIDRLNFLSQGPTPFEGSWVQDDVPDTYH